MSTYFFLLVSILICFLSLFLIFFITNKSIKQNTNRIRLASVTAIICGFLNGTIPYSCLLTLKVANFNSKNLLTFLIISLASTLFFFLYFVLMNMMEKIPLMPKGEKPL